MFAGGLHGRPEKLLWTVAKKPAFHAVLDLEILVGENAKQDDIPVLAIPKDVLFLSTFHPESERAEHSDPDVQPTVGPGVDAVEVEPAKAVADQQGHGFQSRRCRVFLSERERDLRPSVDLVDPLKRDVPDQSVIFLGDDRQHQFAGIRQTRAKIFELRSTGIRKYAVAGEPGDMGIVVPSVPITVDDVVLDRRTEVDGVPFQKGRLYHYIEITMRISGKVSVIQCFTDVYGDGRSRPLRSRSCEAAYNQAVVSEKIF